MWRKPPAYLDEGPDRVARWSAKAFDQRAKSAQLGSSNTELGNAAQDLHQETRHDALARVEVAFELQLLAAQNEQNAGGDHRVADGANNPSRTS